MADLNKIYNALREKGVVTKSYEEFANAMADGNKRKNVYNALAQQGLVTKSYKQFSDAVAPSHAPQTTQSTSTAPRNNDWVKQGLSVFKGVPSMPTPNIPSYRPTPLKPEAPQTQGNFDDIIASGNVYKDDDTYNTVVSAIDERIKQAQQQYQALLKQHSQNVKKGRKEASFWERLGAMPDVDDVPTKTSDDVLTPESDQLRAARETLHRLQNTRVQLERGRESKTQGEELAKRRKDGSSLLERAAYKTAISLENFGKGFMDALRGSDMWATNDAANDLTAVKNIVDKVDRWNTLTDKEKSAMTSADLLKIKPTDEELDILNNYALAYNVNAQAQDPLSSNWSYTAGGVSANSALFGIEMAASGGMNVSSSTGRAIEKGALKLSQKAVKNGLEKLVGKTFEKSLARKIAGGVGQLPVQFGMAALESTVLQNGLTERKAQEYEIGTPLMSMDDDGVLRYSESLGKLDAKSAHNRALVEQTIENQTEMLGGQIGEVLGGLTKVGVKVLNKTKLGENITKLMTDVSSNQFNRIMNNALNTAGYNGFLGEYLEEHAGDVEQALFLGTMTFDTDPETGIYNKEHILETMSGLAPMMGGHMVMEGTSYGASRARMAMMLSMAERKGNKLFGDERWAQVKQSLGGLDNQQFADKLSSMLQDKTLSDKQKKAVYNYAFYEKARQGFELMSLKQDMEGAVSLIDKNSRTNFVIGYEKGGQAAGELLTNLQKAQRNLRVRLGDYGYRQLFEENGDDFNKAYNSGMLDTDQKKQAYLDYVNALSCYQGALQRLHNDKKSELVNAKTDVDNIMDEQGNIVSATTTDGKKVNIVNGNVVLDEDGSVNVEKSGSLVVVDSDGKRKMISASEVASVDSATKASDVLAQKNKEIVDKYAAEEMSQKIQVGAQLPILTPNGSGIATIVSVNEDGSVSFKMGDSENIITTDANNLYVMNLNAEVSSALREDDDAEQSTESAPEVATEGERPLTDVPSPAEESREYAQGDVFDVVVDGQKMHAEIVSPKDADGRFVVYVDDGESVRSLYVTPEELAAMEYKEPKEEPLTESENPRTIDTEEPPISNAAPTEHTPTALERIPRDEKGNAQFHDVDTETAWDGLVEMSGNEETAHKVAEASLANAEKRLKAAKALKEKGETPEELLQSIKENEAAVAEAQRTVDAWKAIVGEKSRREEAVRAEAERIATEKAEEERKAAEERERAEKEEKARIEAEKAEEEARVEAERKAEEERIAKQKAEEAESDKEEAEKRMDDEEPKPVGSGVFGNIYNQFKGKVKEAFDFLMKHKGGDLLGVFHRKDVGDIDLVWGDHGGGLAHIIRRHIIEQNDFKNVDEIQKVIEDVIRNGLIVRENKDKINIEYNGYRVSIKKTIRDSKGNVVENKNWIVTAFDKSKPKHEKRNPSSSETLTTPSANQKADGVTLPSNEDSIDKGSKKAEKKQKKQSVFDKAKEIADKEEKTEKNPSGNKLVTDERYEELKKRMKAKLGQLNAGVDPEMLSIGTEMAVYHIEKGARTFADYAKSMIADLGDTIRPYLKAFYNGARDLPEMENSGLSAEMTPYEEVRSFDTANFDKKKKGNNREQYQSRPSAENVAADNPQSWVGRTFTTNTGAELVCKDVDGSYATFLNKNTFMNVGFEVATVQDYIKRGVLDMEETASERKNESVTEKAAEIDNEEELEGQHSGYSITPAQYTTKRGAVLDMHLVKFDKRLTDFGYKKAVKYAKSTKGWYDRKEGGFMMRSKSDADGLARLLMDDERGEHFIESDGQTHKEEVGSKKSIFDKAAEIAEKEEKKRQEAATKSTETTDKSSKVTEQSTEDGAPRLRQATAADLEKRSIVYHNGAPTHIMSIMGVGELASEKNKIERVYLTNGEVVAPEELQVEDKSDITEEENGGDISESEENAVTSQQTESDSVKEETTQKEKDNGLQRVHAVRTEGLPSDSSGHERRLEKERGETGERAGQKSGGTDGEGKRDSNGHDRSVSSRLQDTVGIKNSRNNHSERGVDHAPKSVDARIDANIAAIELAKRLIENGEPATSEQMETLRKFSGWGGLGAAFNTDTYNREQLERNRRIHELLGDEAYEEAVMSANSAYYTPAAVTDTLWDIARQMGFKGGNVLEGSAGIGNIIGQMPTDMSVASDIHAVEIDRTSGGILSLLYPDAKVEIQGFEQTRVPNGSVDLAITNVPFVANMKVPKDTTGDADLSRRFNNSIQDFCIAKNVRKLREGGIGIFISSNGTLDKSSNLRNWVVNDGDADFVGAFRLNNKTFLGAPVTTDIIVIRRRVGGRKSANAINVGDIGVERTAEYDTGETKKVKGKEVPVVKQLPMDYNKYFIEHPENMAGEMQFGFERGDTYRPESKGLFPIDDKEQYRMLSDFVKSLKEEEVGDYSETESKPRFVNNSGSDGKKIGELYVKDGQIVTAGFGGYYTTDINSNKVKGHTKEECLSSYTAIKEALSEVLVYQTEHEDSKGLKPLLDKLNKAFDSFVAIYGPLHKNPSIAFLRRDVDFPNVLSLETFEERGDGKGGTIRKYSKADVMNGRVVEKAVEPHPTNVKDGVVASLFKTGGVDTAYIAGELGMPEEEVRMEILDSELAFENPMTGKVEVAYQYLSGNVREKLQQAQENNTDGKYEKNIKALRRVVPMDIPAHLIDFALGSSWIAPSFYEAYVKDRTGVSVKFTSVGGTWAMGAPVYTGNEQNRFFGVYSEKLKTTIQGHALIEAAIKNKSIIVARTTNGETETDREATQACAAKIDEIRQDFKDWMRQRMQSDPALSERMEREYNETFNNYAPMVVTDEYAPKHYPGMATEVGGKPFELRGHQARAVVTCVTQPTLLAHEVGTGKTFTLITTAMEMRRLGTAKKPMIVVQNATVGQFVSSAKALYPNAKILTIDDSDTSSDGRKNFYAKIRYNDWDMIVVPQSVLDKIPDSKERMAVFIRSRIEEKMATIEKLSASVFGRDPIVSQAKREVEKLEKELAELTEEDGANDNTSVSLMEDATSQMSAKEAKRRALARHNAEVTAQEMLDRATDDVVNFDEMGVDALLVDEAHEYKHLGFSTAMARGVKGVDPSYSKKSQGLYLKVQAVKERNNGKNVVFATGTPISNTAAEIWTFMRYLMSEDVLKEYGIYYFDDFVRNFGNIQQMPEFTTNGKFKETNRFAGYMNLPELVRMWTRVSDTVLTKEAAGVTDKIPELEGGKAQDIYLPQTRALRSVMKYVRKQLDDYEKMSGKEKKANSHIPLVMYGIAKAAAVDARLVQNDAEDDPGSKTNEAVRQTLRSLNETEGYKGTVAIFADNYQNKRSGFNLYEDIKEKLIDSGVPQSEIVVMKSGMSIKKKEDIFEKVNRGEVRVILGSTFTLGTGVNIQERLHTLIHLDAPNRPMDYTQRNGRILRQGNIHKEMGNPVRILRFGVEDSLDVTAYQRLKTKGAIADSIMHGKELLKDSMSNRVLEEEEDAFGDTVAQLSGSEYAILKNNAEKNVRKYESRKKQWEADQTYIHNARPKLEGIVKASEKIAEEQRGYLDRLHEESQGNGIRVGKHEYASVDDMADFIKAHNKAATETMNDMKSGKLTGAQTRELAVKAGGFTFDVKTILAKETAWKGGGLFAEVHRKMTYSCKKLGLDDVPVKQSLLRNALTDIMENVLTGKDFKERIEAAEQSAEHNRAELEQIKKREGKPFEFEKELEKAKAQLTEYTDAMKKELAEKDAKYAKMDAEVEEASGVAVDEEDGELYRDGELERINEEFNNRLSSLAANRNQKDRVLKLGRPSRFLIDGGVTDAEIILEFDKLARKSDEGYKNEHPFDVMDVENLPLAIAYPIAVFDNTNGYSSGKVILTELEKDGRNFIVVVQTISQRRKGGVVLEVNRIDTLFPKEERGIVNWFNKGLASNIDKEKALRFIKALPNHPGTITKEELLSATKEVKNFENSKSSDVGRMSAKAREMAEKLHLDNVEFVTDTSVLTGRQKKAKGFFNPQTWKITIVLSNHTDASDVERTILHEAVAHYGLRQLFGERFDTFLDNVYENAEDSIRGRIDEIMKEKGVSRRTATEEYLAELAERTDFTDKEAGWWYRIKRAFLSMLNSLGLNFGGVELTDNELRYILWRSYENFAEPGSYRTIFEEAKDMAKQQELKVGNYAEREAENDSASEDGLLFRDGGTEYDFPGEDDAQKLYNAAVDGRKSRAIESWQDEMYPVKMLQEAIEKATGEKIADFENAYLLENQLGSAGNATLEKYAREVQNPMRKVYLDMLKAKFDGGSKVTKSDINKYVIAVHGLERNKYMADKNKGLTDARRDYSGFTALFGNGEQVEVEELERRAEEYIGKFEDAVGKDKADKLWSLVDESRQRTLDELVRSGLVSGDVADEWLRRFEHYVPLQGFSEEVIGEDRNANFENHITGRMSEARDPLATLVNMEYVAVTSGNHNRVKQALYNLALNHRTNLLSVMPMFSVKNPITGEWEDAVPQIDETMSPIERQQEVDKFIKQMRVRMREEKDLPESDKTVKDARKVSIGSKVLPKAMPDFIVRMKVNGRQYAVVLNGNPRAAQAINGRLKEHPNKALQKISGVTRFMSAAVTAWNAAFMLSNFARDVQAANAFAYSNEGAKYAAMMDAEIHKNMSLTSLGRDLFGMKNKGIYKLYYKYRHNQLDMSNERERFFKEFVDNGGETGYTQMVDIDKIAKQMQKDEFSAIKAIKSVGKFIELANKGFENATRFAAYATSRKMGKSVMQSINDAKEISVNFNRHGNGRNGYVIAKSLYQFLNPTIQGLEKQLRTIKEHPLDGTAVLIATPIAIGFAIPLVNIGLAMLSGGGDDDKKYYWSLSDWTRRNNLIIGVNGKFIKIPLPPELRVFYGIGEMIASKMSNPYDKTNLLTEIPKHISETLPFNDTNSTFPSFVKPFIESEITDKDFMGRKITGRSDYNTQDPEWKRAGYNTDDEYIAAAKWWHSLFTDNNNERGSWFAEINPSVAEHLIKGYTGGIGSIVGQVYTTVKAIAKGNEKDYSDSRNWPIVNRVYVQTTKEDAVKKTTNTAYRFYQDNYKNYEHTFKETLKDEKSGIFQKAQMISNMVETSEYKRYRMTEPFIKADKLLWDEIKTLREADDKESLEWIEKEQTRLRNTLVDVSEKFDNYDNAGLTDKLDRMSKPGAYKSDLKIDVKSAPNKDMRKFANEYNSKVSKYKYQTIKDGQDVKKHIRVNK